MMQTQDEAILELYKKIRDLEETIADKLSNVENDLEQIKDTIGSLDTSNDWRR